MSKVILFSTRFLEQNNKLFCKDNYDLLDCQSPKYIKFFLSSDLPLEIIQYFNNLYCKEFFCKYKDEKDNPIVLNDNNYVELGKKLWGRIPGEFDKDDWDGFFSDLGKLSKLYGIEIHKGEDSNNELVIKDRTIEGNEEHLHEYIKKIEDAPFNNGIALNTDFGGAIDKKSIDRRFKIYKLRQGGLNDIQAFGVWCLSEKSKDLEWYEALYEELKIQMTNDKENKTQEGIDFGSVDDILFFLHDGDIGEQKPFAVKHYKEGKDKFNFLDDGKSLSVAIFQHSLSSIATILSNSNINDAIKAAIVEMEKGGQKACLYGLSDFLALYTGKADDENLKNKLDGAKKIFKVDEKDVFFLRNCYQLSNAEKKEDIFYEANHEINEMIKKIQNQ